MNMTLRNTDFRNDGIFGMLLDDQGNHFCFTLQHAYPGLATGDSWVPKIPKGTYTCKKGQHQLAHMTEPFTTFEVQNVPGHTNILIHKGNYNDDSEGCILLGTTIGKTSSSPWMLTGSAPMFNKFLQIQANCDTFVLTVE